MELSHYENSFHNYYSHESNWFTTAPIGAISKAIDKSGWKKQILIY